MSLEIEIQGSKIGSNPGGKCLISGLGNPFQAYLKFCPRGSRFPSNIYLNAKNQPVYEAVTNELFKLFGLKVPVYYVLTRPDMFRFITPKKSEIGENHRRYFVSKLILEKSWPTHPACREHMDEQSIYRDLLRVEDVEGKADNFIFLDSPEGGKLFYIDLGCSLGIRAKEGIVLVKGNVIRDLERSKLKELRKKISSYSVRTDGGERLLNMGWLIDTLGELNIPILNPRPEHRPLTSLLEVEEIETLKRFLTVCFGEQINKYKKSDKVVRHF